LATVTSLRAHNIPSRNTTPYGFSSYEPPSLSLPLWQTLHPRTSNSGLDHRPGLWCHWSFTPLQYLLYCGRGLKGMVCRQNPRQKKTSCSESCSPVMAPAETQQIVFGDARSCIQNGGVNFEQWSL